MTESEWLASTGPAAMIQRLMHGSMNVVRPIGRPAVSDRKLRLFACACCRVCWPLLTDERSRRAVEVAERFADGAATTGELDSACEGGETANGSALDRGGNSDAAFLAAWAADPDPQRAARHISGGDNRTASIARRAISRIASANILRDIIGNPFAPVVLPDRSACKKCKGKGTVPAGAGGAVVGRPDRVACPACNGTGHQPCPYLTPLVLAIAETAYEDRNERGELLPVNLMALHDALVDAGFPTEEVCPTCKGKREYPDPPFLRLYTRCLSPEPPWGGSVGRWATGKIPHPLLAHLRSEGPHVRGCWAVDLVLGKE